VDIYDPEIRRQYCRERADRISDDYRRAQVQRDERRKPVNAAWMRSMWQRIRAQVPDRVPVYRS
jgi:hypothetical protein